MSDVKNLLKLKIDANYAEFKERWLQMSPAELIERCEKLAAVTRMAKELPAYVSKDHAEYLLRFKNPLEVVSDRWIGLNGLDGIIDGDLKYLLWDIVDKGDAEVDYEIEPGGQTQGPMMEM